MSPIRRRELRRNARCLAATVLVASAALSSNTASAANVSWTDAANKWESNNWTGGVGTNPPTAADTAIIGNGGVVGYDATTGTRTVLALQVGNPNIGNGTLNISAGSLTVTNNVTISGQGNTSGTINITGTGSLNVGGIVQDGGNGPSTVTLNGGTLDLASDGSPGSIAVNTFNAQSGTLRNVSQIFLGDNSTVTALTKITSGTLTLSGTNTYTGGTNINGGTLALGSSAALGTTGTISFAGGTLQYSASNTTDYSNRFSNAAAQAYSIDTNGQNVTFATGLTSSGGTFTKLGTGTLTFTAANTYTGATTISAGTLQLGNGGTTGSLSTSSAITDNGNFTINRSNAVSQGTDFSGAAISGTGSLTQAGAGTLTLTAANTYQGGTTVNAGKLLVNNATGSGTGTGAVTVNNSGTLGGTGTISGAVTLNNTATINPGPSGADGTSASVGTLRTGALTLAGTNTFHEDAFGTAPANWDQLVVSGGATLGTTSSLQLAIATAGLNFIAGTTYVLIDANTITGSFANATEGSIVTVNGYNFTAHYDTAAGDFDLVAIPEPSTWVAAALTLLAIGYTQRPKVIAALAKVSKV